MKRIIFLLAFVFYCISALYGQKVDGIKAEQSGDFIKISYKILNSTPSQVFRVRILFSENGGLNQEIKTISGDVGDQVAGGKEEYWALWDVLKDKEQVQSLEFVVRAELIRNLNEEDKAKRKEKIKGSYVIMASMENDGPSNIFGAQLGYLNRWGVLARGNFGEKIFDKNDPLQTYPAFSVGVNVTKSMVLRKNFQMHCFAGPGFSKLERNAEVQYELSTFVTIEGGFLLSAYLVSLSIDLSFVRQSAVDNGNIFPHIGLGFKF